MSADVFAPIHALVLAESDRSHRSRLEQFIYAAVCAWPQLSIHHAAQAAMQLSTRYYIHTLDSYEAIAHTVEQIDLRSAWEWDYYGFTPAAGAMPVILGYADDPQLYFCREDVSSTTAQHVPHRGEKAQLWRTRRNHLNDTDSTSYAGFHRAFTPDAFTMLGNSKKIGALATWEKNSDHAASWAELPYPPQLGDFPPAELTPGNAWYHFRIGTHLGRDGFAEIALCLGNVFCQHLPQVWRDNSHPGLPADPRTVLLESEAAGSIAIARLGAMPRRGGSFFGDAIIDSDIPLPDSFRLPVVLDAAQHIQELLQGDTHAVCGATWFVDDPLF